MHKAALFSSAFLAVAASADAVNIFAPGDFIIPIDYQSESNSPGSGAEDPQFVIDGNNGTKYLNFGKENSGFIVTPAGGSSTVQSMTFVTGNDAEGRDPASYTLYGTNDAVGSYNNSFGNLESWTLISTGGLTLPSGRNTLSGAVDLTNSTAYSSYRLVFDSVKNAGENSMQVSEVQFFTGTGGGGSSILSAGDAILGIDFDPGAGNSSSPGSGNEDAFKVIDGDNFSKYLNFGERGSGFIITPAGGASIIDSVTMVTGGDAEERDPAFYSIYGTNDAITSAAHSNGNAETWELIQDGSVTLPAGRNAAGSPIAISGASAYTSYRVVFDEVKNEGAANSMQLSEIQFTGTFVPEPSTGLLALFAGATLLFRRRRS